MPRFRGGTVKKVLLFASIPCTGGTAWSHINARRGPQTRANIFRHRALAAKLWNNFEKAAEVCIRNGGYVAIEWPRSCLYWHWRRVKRFITKHKLTKCHLDGCAFGLHSQIPDRTHMLLKKPWTIATNFPATFNSQCARRCTHESQEHLPTQGADTKGTESYTPLLVAAIHRAWEIQVRDDRA